ncbi:MAG: hypothetical protein R6V47_04350 [Candidatus Delongbacteria bacterium]
MELQVISHKTAEDYFKEFYPEDVCPSYAFQLQRMFESGAAREGDYILIRNNGQPFLKTEIYRNNTRRVWERPFELKDPAEPNCEDIYSALELIFKFINDREYFFRRNDILEIVISEDFDQKTVMKELLSRYGYKSFELVEEYYKKDFSEEKENLFKKRLVSFFDLSVSERAGLVLENDIITGIFPNIDPDELYLDYLEEGYDSEKLWKYIYSDRGVEGFIMPVFTSAFKSRIRVLNYGLANNDPETLKNMIFYLFRISSENDIKDLFFNISAKDDRIKQYLISLGFVKINSYMRYA